MLLRLPGVYRPQADTWMLTRALRLAGIRPGAAILDVCCGTGALSIAAARTGPRSVTAVDVCRRAVWTTRLNAWLHGVDLRIEHGDALELTAGRTFDLVLANPPYVPGVAPLPTRGRARAWDAGTDGRAFVDRLCAELPVLLAPGGTALIVHSGLCDEDRTLHQLRGGGLKASVVARATEPFGPVLRRRTRALEELGVIAPGQREEELVVVRADRLEVADA